MRPKEIDVKYYPPVGIECEHVFTQYLDSCYWRVADGQHLIRFDKCKRCGTIIVRKELYD